MKCKIYLSQGHLLIQSPKTGGVLSVHEFPSDATDNKKMSNLFNQTDGFLYNDGETPQFAEFTKEQLELFCKYGKEKNIEEMRKHGFIYFS